LAVGCFDGKLRFFNSSGVLKHRDRDLDYDPLSLTFVNNDEYLAVGGTNR
jgi:hypothetical protein